MSSDRPPPQDTVDPAAVREAAAAFELKLRRRLAADPGNAPALEALGRLLIGENKYEQAREVFAELVARKPKLTLYKLLAECQVVTGRTADAIMSLDHILGLERTSENLLHCVKLKAEAGQAAEVSRLLALGRDWFPEDVNVLLRQAAGLRAGEDASAELAALAAAAQTPAFMGNLRLLEAMTVTRAWQNRRRAGLDPGAAASWQDLQTWSDPEGLAEYRAALDRRLANGATASPILARAWVGLVDQAWDESERLIAMVRAAQSGGIADAVHFDSAFYRALARQQDSDILSAYAPLEELRGGPPGPTLFLASDPVYFRKFTLPLLEQIPARAPRLRVHVHLLDGDPGEWRDCLQAAVARTAAVSLSAEASGAKNQPGTAAIYYHAVRFVRLHEFAVRNACPSLVIDVDTDLGGDPSDLIAQFARRDLGLFATPTAFQPWDKFGAGCVGVSPTGAGLAFTRLVAAYITHLHRTGVSHWGIDQIALFGAYHHLAREGRLPDTHFFKSDARAILRSVAGFKKFAK